MEDVRPTTASLLRDRLRIHIVLKTILLAWAEKALEAVLPGSSDPPASTYIMPRGLWVCKRGRSGIILVEGGACLNNARTR